MVTKITVSWTQELRITPGGKKEKKKKSLVFILENGQSSREADSAVLTDFALQSYKQECVSMFTFDMLWRSGKIVCVCVFVLLFVLEMLVLGKWMRITYEDKYAVL